MKITTDQSNYIQEVLYSNWKPNNHEREEEHEIDIEVSEDAKAWGWQWLVIQYTVIEVPVHDEVYNEFDRYITVNEIKVLMTDGDTCTIDSGHLKQFKFTA